MVKASLTTPFALYAMRRRLISLSCTAEEGRAVKSRTLGGIQVAERERVIHSFYRTLGATRSESRSGPVHCPKTVADRMGAEIRWGSPDEVAQSACASACAFMPLNHVGCADLNQPGSTWGGHVPRTLPCYRITDLSILDKYTSRLSTQAGSYHFDDFYLTRVPRRPGRLAG